MRAILLVAKSRDVARLHSILARAAIGQTRRTGLLVRSTASRFAAAHDAVWLNRVSEYPLIHCLILIFQFPSRLPFPFNWTMRRRAMKTVSDSAEFAAKYEAMK
jgi:hypothetical protein